MAEIAHVGLLFPGSSAVDDYFRLAFRLNPEVIVHVATTPIPDGGARAVAGDDLGAAVKDMGNHDNLRYGANQLRDAPELSAVAWACTSCSFMWGYDGTRDQVRVLTEATGVPATTTSLAIDAALRRLGVTRIAIASPYPAELTTEFGRFLTAGGFTVLAEFSLNLFSVAEMAALTDADVLALAESADHPDAEAIVIPETGLHTATVLSAVESARGKPVITANQATLWHALELSGHFVPQPGFGALFQ